MADVFLDTIGEGLWLVARTHELAFSVIVISLGWSILWRLLNEDVKDHSRCYIWNDAVGPCVVGILVLVTLVNHVRSFKAWLMERCYLEGNPTFSVVQKVWEWIECCGKATVEADSRT